jgi:predicted GNAT family N-acyltransferase
MFIDECIKDTITYANIIQYLRMPHKILLSTEKAFILLLTKHSFYITDCVDSECDNIINELKKYKIKIITTLNQKLFELLKKIFKNADICSQAVYCGEKLENNKLMQLKKEDLEYVKKTYRGENHEKEIEEIFKENNLLGYYENNELIGYVGRHLHYSIGLLYVKEKFRKKGYGSTILKTAFLFWENQVPFTHIIIGNTVSENLHKKIHCKFGKKKVYWLYNDDFIC